MKTKMKTWILLPALLLGLASCATSDGQIRDYLKKNPQVLFEVIEDNPEMFLETVNRAARKAQGAQAEKQQSEREQRVQEQLKNPLKPKLEKSRVLAGSPEAKIVIVEYADFQCPACSMAAANLKKVLEKYGDRLQFHYKNMPLDFHPMAMPASSYYEALMKQDRAKARKFYDSVFANQRALSDAFLKETAKKAGADMMRLEADVKSEAVARTIKNDQEEFVNLGFTGTPVIVVNGIALEGAQPSEAIERVIELTSK